MMEGEARSRLLPEAIASVGRINEPQLVQSNQRILGVGVQFHPSESRDVA